MTYDELRESLCGVGFTTATPFGDDGERILPGKIADNVRTLYDAGGRVFIPCGNTGEYYSLSQSERIEVVRSTVEAVDDDATVVGGAGGSTKDATELLEAYEAAGADAAMIMYPRHTYIHERGLIDYYRSIASSTDLGIVVYKRGPKISETVLAELASIENVVAVKWAVNDVKAFGSAVEVVSDDVVWLNGVAERFAPAYALEGADGFTTGIGNFVPKPVLALARELDEENWKRAKRIRNDLRPLEALRDEAGGGSQFSSAKNVPAVKHGLDVQGMYGGPVRSPIVQLSRADEERVETYIEEVEHREIG